MNFKDFYTFLTESDTNLNKSIDNIVLMEGGAAGHMMHIIDDREQTFGELKEMLKEVFSGNVEITAKVDGQNISVTWKDGKVGLARNKATIKNPMSVVETADMFDGRGEIKNAFVNSLKAIEGAFKKINKDVLNKWFENGKRFMSAEIIYPPTRNVIYYGNRCMIMIHNLTEYDEQGNKVDEDPTAAKEIYDVLRKAGATNQEGFEITGPKSLSIKNTVRAAKNLKNVTEQLDEFMKKNDLKDSDTLADFFNKKWKEYIIEQFGDNITDELVDILVDRFANFVKKPISREIYKMVEKAGLDKDKFIKTFNEINSNAGLIGSKFGDELEIIIVKAGAIFLKCLSGFIAVNPEESVSNLTNQVNDTIEELKNSGEVNNSKKLYRQIEKLNKIGMDNIVPEEGIVFKHNGKVFKITGAFAPINMILGYIKYGR